MVPERTCHRRFLFQSIKQKQREFLFFSLNLLSKSFLFFAIKPSSVFINRSTARITIYDIVRERTNIHYIINNVLYLGADIRSPEIRQHEEASAGLTTTV